MGRHQRERPVCCNQRVDHRLGVLEVHVVVARTVHDEQAAAQVLRVRERRVATLAGKRLSITGFLRRPRSEAFAAARKAGAIIQSKPGRTTDVLVRGRPNQLQIAGRDGGTKLMEIRRLAALGHRITIIGEQQFWKLAASKTRARRRKG